MNRIGTIVMGACAALMIGHVVHADRIELIQRPK